MMYVAMIFKTVLGRLGYLAIVIGFIAAPIFVDFVRLPIAPHNVPSEIDGRTLISLLMAVCAVPLSDLLENSQNVIRLNSHWGSRVQKTCLTLSIILLVIAIIWLASVEGTLTANQRGTLYLSFVPSVMFATLVRAFCGYCIAKNRELRQ